MKRVLMFAAIFNVFQLIKSMEKCNYDAHNFQIDSMIATSFMWCRNFENSSQLNLPNSLMKNSTEKLSESLKILSAKTVILNSKFDLVALIGHYLSSYFLYRKNSNKYIFFNNIRGIDFDFFAKNRFIFQEKFEILFHFTIYNVEFYHNNQKIEKCNQDFLNRTSNYPIEFFIIIVRVHQDKNHKVCVLMFNNFHINSIVFNYLQISFIHKNFFAFESPDSYDGFRSNISKLEFSLYNYKIDEKILHPYLFSEVKILMISHSISKIDDHVFKTVHLLELLRFKLNNLHNFFHIVGIKWMQSLKYNLEYAWLSPTYVDIPLIVEYVKTEPQIFIRDNFEITDEDFCVFKDYPHNKLIFTVFGFNQTKCSCTLVWLIQNFSVFSKSIYNYESSIYMQSVNMVKLCLLNGKSFIQSCIDEKEIRKKISYCNFKTNKTEMFLSDSEIVSIFDNLKYFFVIIFKPVVCFTGFVLNIIIVRVVLIGKREIKDNF
jgi:hypothetical protein